MTSMKPYETDVGKPSKKIRAKMAKLKKSLHQSWRNSLKTSRHYRSKPNPAGNAVVWLVRQPCCGATAQGGLRRFSAPSGPAPSAVEELPPRVSRGRHPCPPGQSSGGVHAPRGGSGPFGAISVVVLLWRMMRRIVAGLSKAQTAVLVAQPRTKGDSREAREKGHQCQSRVWYRSGKAGVKLTDVYVSGVFRTTRITRDVAV